jgi:hypothetical protein
VIGFERTASGTYMERVGAAGDVPFCNKKLCFTATDQAFLIELLAELAALPDCRYVKYSIEPRDGMYLGRCFMVTEERVGELWARYKQHPKLFCSIQDDDFTERFRGLS